jgi:flavin-dependent dehydrogenase
MPPWSDHVEIYFADELEAYVTPVGAGEIGVAFLWTPHDGKARSCAELLSRVPALARRLDGVASSSATVGLGPLALEVRTITAPRFALLGDAAGTIDAITGEGISLALETAHELCVAWRDTARLERYQRAHSRMFRRYARLSHVLLGLTHRPALRRRVVTALSRRPRLFETLVHHLI